MTISFPFDPSSVPRAREFVANAIEPCSAATAHTATLLTSELATNAIVHAHSGFSLSVERGPASVRISVTDRGDGQPSVGNPRPQDASGRGLLIIERLAIAWGVEPSAGGGKRVWFDLACSSNP